jgi:hypothetical protein
MLASRVSCLLVFGLLLACVVLSAANSELDPRNSSPRTEENEENGVQTEPTEIETRDDKAQPVVTPESLPNDSEGLHDVPMDALQSPSEEESNDSGTATEVTREVDEAEEEKPHVLEPAQLETTDAVPAMPTLSPATQEVPRHTQRGHFLYDDDDDDDDDEDEDEDYSYHGNARPQVPETHFLCRECGSSICSMYDHLHNFEPTGALLAGKTHEDELGPDGALLHVSVNVRFFFSLPTQIYDTLAGCRSLPLEQRSVSMEGVKPKWALPYRKVIHPLLQRWLLLTSLQMWH